MKRISALLALAVTLSGGVISSNAAQFSIANAPFVPILEGSTYSLNLDLTSVWTPSPGQGVISASLVMSLTDPSAFVVGAPVGGNTETVTIELDGAFWREQTDFISVTFGGAVAVSTLVDNLLQIDITPEGGPTRLDFYALNFTTGDLAVTVPDGGSSLALLGLAMLGLGWVGRRRIA